jgi:hypothetical protein
MNTNCNDIPGSTTSFVSNNLSDVSPKIGGHP